MAPANVSLSERSIDEVEKIQNDARIHSLEELCRVYMIDLQTTTELLDNTGINSLVQVREAIEDGNGEGKAGGKLKPWVDQLIGRQYLGDFGKTPSGPIIEAMAETIQTVQKEKGAVTDYRVRIIGGYRWGRVENDDAAISMNPLPDLSTA